MTDNQIRTQFEALEIKLRNVVLRYKDLQTRLELATRENESLKHTLADTLKENQELNKKLNQRVKNFKKSDKITKIAVNNLNSTGNPAELKEKLDQYILEIDRCISQLSK
ncbi:hypothetical protein VB264_02325 [Arcicella aquatica]|uniref:Uncharacterized protein n=1 Tax=Arcicella aquatica TaxID=217141 RepID=A0ABU5QHS0_9BACT|nr:hypothetical protein [Arcicella aquatica]MEA5256601.1 hypothetical protein [Arcicella aquatica]